jgi:hypothetical protein
VPRPLRGPLIAGGTLPSAKAVRRQARLNQRPSNAELELRNTPVQQIIDKRHRAIQTGGTLPAASALVLNGSLAGFVPETDVKELPPKIRHPLVG